jgi:mono/diheme cytochrome c family protein
MGRPRQEVLLMNYPVWDIPGSGLLIAFVAIVHVVVSHFAVGGGLFLVLTERKARREHDDSLLGYVRQHSRFFVLLTLVFGAITGVGIWFTIGLVHPQATSTLINVFVWAWAIEWTFFVAEIAAAMVYYYGWDRLSPRVHEAVGWIYFANAWLSLVVITGILTFMLTPGEWLVTRGFWGGFFNPTYWPGVVARTAASVGLAGLYALLTVSWCTDPDLKEKIARYAGLGWILPMAVALPLTLAWYLTAASSAGVPVAEVLGAKDGSLWAMLAAVFSNPGTGYPVAQRAAWWTLVASAGAVALTLFVVFVRNRTYGRAITSSLMVLGFVAMGGSEWVREDLRKPYVLYNVMFVNGVRLSPADSAAQPPADTVDRFGADAFTVDALNTRGVLNTSAWVRPTPPDLLAPHEYPQRAAHQGRELFRVLCSACHTTDGYLALRPLVRGKSAAAFDGMLTKLAAPVDRAGKGTTWDNPDLRLRTWRDRRMPPFVGTVEERQILAAYLALLGGAAPADVVLGTPRSAELGKAVFESQCAMCHGPDGVAPFNHKGRDPAVFYEMIGRLPQVNEMMPAFEGTDEERRAVAAHLATLAPTISKGGAR